MLWQTSRYLLDLTSPKVMGIVNLTPDSFYDGGSYSGNLRDALAHAELLRAQGAAILDVGAESSRPGAKALDANAEWQRLEPLLQELLRWDTPISIDTYHPETMQRALDMGVDIINDIWALRQPGALEVCARFTQAGVCLMHMHGEPATMQQQPLQDEVDIVSTVQRFLQVRMDSACQHGIAAQRICIDPGIGFGKTVAHNFALLRGQAQLLALGRPILVGWSRKSALGAVTGLPAERRGAASVAAALLAAQQGAHILRVHDVEDTVAALKVWQASL